MPEAAIFQGEHEEAMATFTVLLDLPDTQPATLQVTLKLRVVTKLTSRLAHILLAPPPVRNRMTPTPRSNPRALAHRQIPGALAAPARMHHQPLAQARHPQKRVPVRRPLSRLPSKCESLGQKSWRVEWPNHRRLVRSEFHDSSESVKCLSKC